jgi:hypothetical protein
MTICFMGGKAGMAKMFEWQLLKGYWVPAAFFAVGQLFNLMQNVFISGSTRKVFSQLRILLTALLSKFIMGTGYTSLQWLMISSIVVSVFQFQFLTDSSPNPLAGSTVITGFIFSIMSNVCAVLGSLLGEKHMKATKKLPFYLQKFQFELWTLFFSIIGVFVTNPIGNMMADGCVLAMGQEGVDSLEQIFKLQGVNGKKANVFGAVAKAMFFTIDDAITKIPAKDLKLVNSGMDEEVFFHPNKFSMDAWTKFEDNTLVNVAKNINVQPVSENSGSDTFNQYKSEIMSSNNLYKVIQEYAAVNYRTQIVDQSADLSSWDARDKYIDQKAYATAGMLKNHAASKYRKLPGSMLYDSGFYTKGPFGTKAKYSLTNEQTDKFTMFLGRNTKLTKPDKSKDTNDKEYLKDTVEVEKAFEAFKLFERDSPKMTPVTLDKDKPVKKD